jgi:hypothetical protein
MTTTTNPQSPLTNHYCSPLTTHRSPLSNRHSPITMLRPPPPQDLIVNLERAAREFEMNAEAIAVDQQAPLAKRMLELKRKREHDEADERFRNNLILVCALPTSTRTNTRQTHCFTTISRHDLSPNHVLPFFNLLAVAHALTLFMDCCFLQV